MRVSVSVSSRWLALLNGEAGGSFMECALLGSLVLVFCELLLLALNKNT